MRQPRHPEWPHDNAVGEQPAEEGGRLLGVVTADHDEIRDARHIGEPHHHQALLKIAAAPPDDLQVVLNEVRIRERPRPRGDGDDRRFEREAHLVRAA